MATLPTLTINDQVKVDRLLAAFNNSPAEYKAWLKQALIREVQTREVQALADADQVKYEQRIAEFDGFLDEVP